MLTPDTIKRWSIVMSKTNVIQAPMVQRSFHQPITPTHSHEESFELMQRKAKAYASSTIVPECFRGNIGNCVVAMEMAQRMQMNSLMVMQNMHMIHNRPSWSSAFIIARINSCGKFTHLRYKREGEGMNRSCIAYATDKETGQELESVKVTMQMAKAEGWLDKKGSKWKTMPDLMLQYRAASFFGRAYAADMLLGMQSEEELRDIQPYEIKKVYENSTEVLESNNSVDALVQQAEAEAQQSSTEDENIKD